MPEHKTNSTYDKYIVPPISEVPTALQTLLEQHFKSSSVWQVSMLTKIDELKNQIDAQEKRMEPVISAFEKSGVVKVFIIGTAKVILGLSAVLGAYLFIIERLRTYLH